MEWLKEILTKAKLTDDGKVDVESIMKEITTEFSKHAVPKKEFNDKVAELKKANDTISTLKKENGDNVELQNKIKEYETEIENLKKAAEDIVKMYSLKESLSKADVIDSDYLIYKVGSIAKKTDQ